MAAADQAAADAVINAINALPTDVTVNDKVDIEAARAAYDSLTDNQKALINEDTYKKLTDAETALAAAEKAAGDQAVADTVVNAINALPTEVTVDDTAKLVIRHEQELSVTLTEQQNAILQKIKDNHTELMNLGERDAFRRGFSLAVRLMVEAMTGEKT